jgi:hypothetical protein
MELEREHITIEEEEIQTRIIASNRIDPSKRM